MESGTIARDQLSAFHARQILDLADENLRNRLGSVWGSFNQSSTARAQEIAALADAYRAAPLWAYSATDGAALFKKLCANCHEPDSRGATLAPKLAGSGAKGIDYLAENLLDPNAVIGRDFQAKNVLKVDGLVITGLIQEETDSALTIRTATDPITVAKEEIEEVRVSSNSFMPEGLLNSLNDREKLELLKYLMTL
jgi:putative heme-binding domain-containing protein